MRVVGEDRLSGQRPRSGDNPLVRCAFAYSGQGPQLVIDAIVARMSVAYRRQGRDWIAGPRAGKQPVCPFFSDLGGETGGQELEREVLRQLVGLGLSGRRPFLPFPPRGAVPCE